MDGKNKEKGILKLDPRRKGDLGNELVPQSSYEKAPSSPQPSVDRLSVTWADPGSMTSSGINLFHLPSETPISNDVKFSPTAADGSDDEDYSASLSAVLRQRRASVRRSRKGRTRRTSSPFLADETRPRRRSSVFTTSSGDTAISIEEGQPTVATQEQIFENIHLHKEVLGSVKQQPLGMRRKLKIVHQAKGYIKRHQGQLQERLAQSKNTRDIYARFTIVLATRLQQFKRESANLSNLLIPWELRIKEIESHFGSVVASYFTFLRWLFWVNLVIGFVLLVFVIVPEYLTANPNQDGERKIITEDERKNATNLLTLWEFEGILKYSPIFYGYYSNVERQQYRMPLAYFLTGLVVYIYSFVAILRKMAENSRMSKLSEKEDECIFSWKLFSGWDFMIGNAETAHNRIASVILGFKEALLEEAEKKKDLRNWKTISLRALVNICVVKLLVISAYAVVTVVSRSDDVSKNGGWLRENETTIVVTIISITFPMFFELLGLLEHYHPRKQLRLQLARIMLLNLLNLYSLIFALFSKIDGMSKDLELLKPGLDMNLTTLSDNPVYYNELIGATLPKTCSEILIPCVPCNIILNNAQEFINNPENTKDKHSFMLYSENTTPIFPVADMIKYNDKEMYAAPENLIEKKDDITETTTSNNILLIKELERLRNIGVNQDPSEVNETNYENDDYEYTFDDLETETTVNMMNTPTVDLKNAYFNNTGGEFSTVSNYDRDYNTSENLEANSSAYFDFTEETLLEISTSSYSLSDKANSSNTYSETTSGLEKEPSSTMTTTEILDSISLSPNHSNRGKNQTNIHSVTATTFVEEAMYETTWFNLNLTTESNVPRNTELTKIMLCPDISFNCSSYCGKQNITQSFVIRNCTTVERKCFVSHCEIAPLHLSEIKKNLTNITLFDVVYIDEHNRKMYNLTITTKKKLKKLCWETMFGQELVKLTMMDLVFVVLGTLFMDFFRAFLVRYLNRCWCWDLEKKFPEYGDFKIAENILHLINNQGMVWMGMFFSPGLVVLNVVKLMIMMYLRSWAVMTCNVPHEVVFRVSKSNNFYLALLLTMLFLCVLPVGYSIFLVKPSWHCGPFSEYERIYQILTNNIYKILPKTLNFALEYISSPAIVIPLLVLLVLIIYYLISLTNSLREANNDLKIQLRRERTEERRKMFQLADTRRKGGSSAMDNTPFARWKKALPTFPITKSVDSDERKTSMTDSKIDTNKETKKKGGIFAKIVGMALDKKIDVEVVSDSESSPNNIDDTNDSEFHENLPKEILKLKDIFIHKASDVRKKSNVEFKTDLKQKQEDTNASKDKTEFKKLEHFIEDCNTENDTKTATVKKKSTARQLSETSSQSKQSDSLGSIIPVITISATESVDNILQKKKSDLENIKKSSLEGTKHFDKNKPAQKLKKGDLKYLRRQSSVDSISESKTPKTKSSEYQHSL